MIELILRRFEHCSRCPKQSSRPHRCIECRRIVPGKVARLQFSDPVPTLRLRRCWVGRKVLLELNFAELCIVEKTKFVSQTPQSSDKTELRPDDVNQVTELHPFG